MLGFAGYIGNKEYAEKLDKKKVSESSMSIYKRMGYDNIWIEWRSSKKFINDKCCSDNENYGIVLDGIILNKQLLFGKYKCERIFDLMVEMYRQNGETFFKELRGQFSGTFSDKKRGITLIFTNHTGEKTVFYSLNKEYLFFASKVQDIMECLKICGIPFNLSVAGAYSILTYAYMYDNLTICEQIKRLRPGEYLWVSDRKYEVRTYYKVQNQHNLKISEAEAIEEIDRLFSKAVSMQIEKNREYEYRDFVPLSAGLDSRMTTFCVRKIVSSPIYSFTYSESDQLDNKIPMKIAGDLKNHWIFKNLDNGLSLYDIESATRLGDGLLYYAWPAQLDDFIKIIDKEKLGVVHTGVIGDVVTGTFFRTNERRKYKIGDGAYSVKLIHRLKENIKPVEYENYEIGMYYNRAFNGACLGYALTFQQYSEAMSPFMDVEFMDFCMKLPLEFRLHHNIYYKWVNKYYPEAAIYSHNGVKIPSYKYPDLKLRGKQINFEKIPSLIGTIVQAKFNKRYNMNPFEYWYTHNHNMQEYLNDYFRQNIKVLDCHRDLKADTITLYEQGNTIEKLLAISLIAMVVEFF